VLDDNCFVARLPEVAMAEVAAVKPTGVPSQQPLPMAGETGHRYLQKQVKLSSHEDEGKDEEFLDHNKFLQRIKECSVVEIIHKSGAPLTP
jgi:hypothetical protein